MFSTADVEALFGNTGRALQRSLLLLDEHAPTASSSSTGGASVASASPGWNPPGSPTSTAGDAAQRPDGSVGVVQSLRGLGQFGAFVAAATAMGERMSREAAAASPAMARQRQRGVAFPVLTHTVKGLRVHHLWGRSSDAQRLWWRPRMEGGDAGRAAERGGEATGAFVAGRLFLAALCADLAHCPATCLQLVRQWGRRPATADAALLRLLEAAGALDGAALPEEVLAGLASQLSSMLLRSCPARPLSAGVLLLPGWAAYITLHAPPSLRASLVARPLSALAANLLPLSLREEALFQLACQQCLTFTSAIAAQILTDRSDGDPRRRVAALQGIYGALLLPMEEHFTADVARPAMACAVHAALAVPFAETHKPALLAMLAPADDEAVRNLLHTVHYRLLLVAETLGRSELVRESRGGAAHAATQQKRYESLLRQSSGKITMHLLAAVAEDKQLVLEASESRSPTGHVLHRLHDGSEDAASPVVHLYVDNGSVLYKVGRARAFTVAKTVEEIFKPLS